MLPRFVCEVLRENKALKLRARATCYEIDFEVYAFRDLSHDEVVRVIAGHVMDNSTGLVKGATYKIVSEIGDNG